ncbi:golgin subfamily B member 1 [Denticeps clupeoides]|uniref:Golgin B1 n=1 Tax=Denticeps clupeoides TaxID=299321 RepID=A0AAY4DTK1_9TELE|nr:golgin subfamily B member 1 [Denticeps clupeoides]
MFSRLAQGMNTVLHELSGEEPPDGSSQETLGSNLQSDDVASDGASEETLERLAQSEQLVVQLKELIREKDGKLASTERQLKEERESGEARFTKLKLQAKAKMAALNKQISDLKGQEGSESSFTVTPGVEEELQQVRLGLQEEQSTSKALREQLLASEQLLREKELDHVEQVHRLQAVVSEKDVRFQEQIQKHEEELLSMTKQTQQDVEIQQALRASQQRIEELEESMHSRSQVVEMLQQELNSADQQKQILTAQFRQMELELAEARRLSEEEQQRWSQQMDQTKAELEVLRRSFESSSREREEAVRILEAEVAQKNSEIEELRESSVNCAEKERDEGMEAELEILRASLEAAERAKEELVKALEMESETNASHLKKLQESLESINQKKEGEARRDQEEVLKMGSEIASLKESLEARRMVEEEGLTLKQVLADVWRGLQSMSVGLEDRVEEEASFPPDPTQCLVALQALEAKIYGQRKEKQERETQIAQVSFRIQTLQDQLDEAMVEKENAFTKISELEQQISNAVTCEQDLLSQVTDESSSEHVTEPSVQDLPRVAKGEQSRETVMMMSGDCHDDVSALQANILALEHQLLEREKELTDLKDQLAEERKVRDAEHCQSQTFEAVINMQEGNVAPDLTEDTPEEDTTLVAVDSSALSTSVDNESSPECSAVQTDSPVGSKGVSSDEMVASSESSEVANSTWTLLEAENQDICQEWPSVLQDISQLHLQSWEESAADQNTSSSTVFQAESHSVVIRESVEVNVHQKWDSAFGSDSGSGQAFAQVLAEELQKRYSELLAELQKLRENNTESQEKIQVLEDELKSVTVNKEEAESNAVVYEEELNALKAELEQSSQQKIINMVLEEQLASLKTETESKEQNIQALLADLNEAQLSLLEQEGQARMLSAQLEDRELTTAELEQRLTGLEATLLEVSKAEITAQNDKSAEIEKLHLQLLQKEQEIMDLNDSMSAKLLQLGDEKFILTSEIKKLKEQVFDLEHVMDEQKSSKECGHENYEEVSKLCKEKEDLESQLAAVKKEGELMKKKLQAALVQRKDLMKKVAAFEKEADRNKEQEVLSNKQTGDTPSEEDAQKGQDMQRTETLLEETRQVLRTKEEDLEMLEQKIFEQDKALSEAQAVNQRLTAEVDKMQQTLEAEDSTARLRSQVCSLESELQSLQKKLQEAVESRKDTIRKAKEKDRHHREQLKQQKDEHNVLLERFEMQGKELVGLLNHLKELEELQILKSDETKEVDKPAGNDWVQEDWVDFAPAEIEKQQIPVPSVEQPSLLAPAQIDRVSLKALEEQVIPEKAVREEMEGCLKETQSLLSSKESELLELGKELQVLKVKEQQIDMLSEELETLREKYLQADTHAEMLKKQLEETAKTNRSDESIINVLQAEVEEFKQFLNNKNDEIGDLSQQLGEQNTLLQKMQQAVSEKDQLITSLQEDLKIEQDKRLRLEAEAPLRQEEEKDGNAKIQQLQRKLQAALISRKEALKVNTELKEEQGVSEKAKAELLQKLEGAESELAKMRAEKEKLIEEVDRALVENQSLGASCESLKLAMDCLLIEKEGSIRQAESTKEAAVQECSELREKAQSMREEYETLLKSYENVSDEAERVRRVLEAARQERQELATKVRVHDSSRKEAEKLAEEAQKEVENMKEKMRKFAKTKQQKIMDLEEENECLREQGEKSGLRKEDAELRLELTKVNEELTMIREELETVQTQRDSLVQQTTVLRQQLALEMKKVKADTVNPTIVTVAEENVVAHGAGTVLTEINRFTSDSASQDSKEQEKLLEDIDLSARESKTVEEKPKINPNENTADEALDDALRTALDSVKELEAALCTEKQLRLELEDKLDILGNELKESRRTEESLKEDSFKQEAKLKELHASLETEKDDLEERLMNQLAQLNGSIAGYQQEAADSRDRLADLQRELENVERERADLEALVESERDRACRLEEDRRQAQRERAAAEAEAGKQRELEQKLKSAQRVKEGSQNRARQLEELLREKQLEVRQMQKDCIQYQEKVSELVKEAKALLLGRDEVRRELEAALLESTKLSEDKTRTEWELTECKRNLEEAQIEASQAYAEMMALQQSSLQREAEIKAEAENTLDEVRFRLGAELKHGELKLEEAYRERDREEEATREARSAAEMAAKEARESQARLDQSLARLAAFSRSMSSLQDDRDRVLDEARQWENRFHGALQGKEAEVREAEARARDLGGQLQKEIAQKEELQVLLERLQKQETEGLLKREEAENKYRESLTALEKDHKSLQEALSQTESSLTQTRSQLASLESEVEGHRHRTKALEEAVGKLQIEANESRAQLKEREAEERRLFLSLEQLESDLRSSKNLTESLQSGLAEKEKRELELLGEKELAVTQAVEEARREADGRAEDAEKELEVRREELRSVEDKLHKAEEDSRNTKARLDAFTKAMGSLQNDRDRVLGQYKQLEERHLKVMIEKDGIIQEAAGENNSLKEQIRMLLAQRDDLNAENAKLAAQLHGYREDLNQVLNMKDSQHRQLLAAQRAHITALEQEKQQMEAALRDLEVPKQVAVESETPRQASGDRRWKVEEATGAEVEKLREQLETARSQVASLEKTLQSERDTQAAHAKELSELRWEGGVLRTEAETAEERVAELARDLVVLEQKLLQEQESAAKLKAQNQSFSQAMASLQDSRDDAVSGAMELNRRLEEVSRALQQAPAPSAGNSTGEVWSLKNALSALQNDRERMLEQLQQQQSELIRLGSGELGKLTQELEKERKNASRMSRGIKEREAQHEAAKRELEMLRSEKADWQAQAEVLKEQTLATLSERDTQLRQLSAVLEETRASQSKATLEQYQREESLAAPGAPQERGETYRAECRELQRRLDEEMEQRMAIEEQLMVAQHRFKSYAQGDWQSAAQANFSEASVLIEPPEGAITQTRSGGPGLSRVLRAAFCSRQRTPLLVSVYLLTVHVLLLLCLGGFL